VKSVGEHNSNDLVFMWVVSMVNCDYKATYISLGCQPPILNLWAMRAMSRSRWLQPRRGTVVFLAIFIPRFPFWDTPGKTRWGPIDGEVGVTPSFRVNFLSFMGLINSNNVAFEGPTLDF